MESTETVAAVKEVEDHQGLGEDVTSEYIPPGQDEIVIPENVSGRNGYRQIQDEQEKGATRDRKNTDQFENDITLLKDYKEGRL